MKLVDLFYPVATGSKRLRLLLTPVGLVVFFGMLLLVVFVCVPVFVALNVLELKMVEEPELEQRFGESYIAYKRRVPMFVPGGAMRQQK